MIRELFRYANIEGSFLISHVEDTRQFTMPHNHFQNYPEIYYLLSGERYYFIKDRTYYVTKGSLVLINSYQIHKTLAARPHVSESDPFNNDFISMKVPLCSKLVDKLFVPEPRNAWPCRTGLYRNAVVENAK